MGCQLEKDVRKTLLAHIDLVATLAPAFGIIKAELNFL